MSLTVVIVFLLVAALAAANGGNDVPKGVATLAGAGVTRYRTAILWGTASTLAGCVCSLALAAKMTKLFSSGIVTARPTDTFAVAVLTGTATWVATATLLRLPVSTTHALVGGLLGAGLLLSSGSVAWSAVPRRLVIPLLLSAGLAYGTSLLLVLLFGRGRRAAKAARGGPVVAAEPGAPERGVPALRPVGVPAGVVPAPSEEAPPLRPVASEPVPSSPALTVAHWLTSGATGFARGLNDTPKIVAIGAFALVPAGMETWQIMLLVAAAMAAGAIAGGMRVAERLGEGVVRMDHREGFLANLTTAGLVGCGAGYGLPMSTTHVSTGAIAGSAGLDLGRLSGGTLRGFLIAWLVTPPFAGAVAALVFALIR